MNNLNNINKEEAMKAYLEKKRQKEDKIALIYHIFQVLLTNIGACASIYFAVIMEFNGGLIIVALICILFAVGFDWTFYDTYIKNNSFSKMKENKQVYSNGQVAFCRRCGTQLLKDSAFCHKCGCEKVR